MDKMSARLCENCGFKFTIDPKNTTAICPSCGAYFSGSGELKAKDKTDPQNTVSAKPVSNSKISKPILVFAVISVIMSTTAAIPVKNTVLCAVQAAVYLILIAFFLGIQVVEEKEIRLHILTFILGTLLIIPFSISCVSCT